MSRVAKRKWSKCVEQPDGTTKAITGKTSKYYGWLNGKRIALAIDKTASERMLAKMIQRQERGAAGMVDAKSQTQNIALHVEDYRNDLEIRGRDDTYIDTTIRRLNILIRECGWATLPTITLDSLMTWGAKAKVNGKAPKTLNQYASAAISLCNWCVARTPPRLYQNPLSDFEPLKHGNADIRPRRAFGVDEVRRLLAAAPEKRRRIYWLAVTTGLRRNELRSLQWGDLRIDNTTRPFIQLRVEQTKAARADTVALRPDVAEMLGSIRPESRQRGEQVFETIPTIQTFRRDLKSAGIPDVDADGRRADFHSLRTTFNTTLAEVGISSIARRTAMRVTSEKLVNDVYLDQDQLPRWDAVERLPSFAAEARPGIERTAAVVTGTHDAKPDANHPSCSVSCSVDGSQNGPNWHIPTERVNDTDVGGNAKKPNKIRGSDPKNDCPGQESNLHSRKRELGPQPSASANSATRALGFSIWERSGGLVVGQCRAGAAAHTHYSRRRACTPNGRLAGGQ